MDVQMPAGEFSLTPSLRDHLQRCLRGAFSRMRSQIVRIVVRLDDLNGSGRRDKVCQVNVTMAGRPEIVIREVQEDMYHAIDRALQRAAHRALRVMMCARAAAATSSDCRVSHAAA